MKKIVVRRVRGRPVSTPQYRRDGSGITDGAVIRQFNPTMLDLGDLSAPCQEKEALVAVFDLTGFTKFCNQVDAYLAIPRFLSDFLEWLFTNIRLRITEKNGGAGGLWAEIPMMTKFLGDGLLILWNTRHMTEEQLCSVTTSLLAITRAYQRDFYPRISAAVNKPPAVLRCAISRGKVFSVGGGRDYVGHCLNNASRLSHLGLSFCFPHRGFQIREYLPAKYLQLFVLKSVCIRGVGDDELVWVVREEFERLPPEDKAIFSQPGVRGRGP